jgi:hypothetical protein
MGDVHRDFHAEAKVNRLRSFPFHLELLGRYRESRAGRPGRLILARSARAGKPIFMIRPS